MGLVEEVSPLTLSLSLLVRRVWFMSGKHLIRLPEEYSGLFRHGQEVEVEITVGVDSYRLKGVIKKYRKGLFVKLPPEASALRNVKGLRVRVYA